MSALVLAFGTVVALANVSWVVTNSIDALPLLLLVQSVGLAVLHVIGWAFVFAAALESLRVLTLTGTGLIFANLVITALVTVWLPGGAGFEALFVVIAMPSFIGWGLLIVAALRGELTDAPPRSRAVRGNGALRRAG